MNFGEGVVVDVTPYTVILFAIADDDRNSFINRVEGIVSNVEVVESVHLNTARALGILELRVAGLSDVFECIVRNIGIIESPRNKDG